RSHTSEQPVARLSVSGAPTRSPSHSTLPFRLIVNCRRAGISRRGVLASRASALAYHRGPRTSCNTSAVGNIAGVTVVDGQRALLTRRGAMHAHVARHEKHAASESMIVRSLC